MAGSLAAPARARQGTALSAALAGEIRSRHVVVGGLVFAVFWWSLLGATSLSPPADAIEQWIWMRSLEWGYYKHPPLPTWLMWAASRVFGSSASTVTALGAILTTTALAIQWRLWRRLRGPAYAFVALLAAACITYYNGRLNYYNHNIVLLLATSAAAHALERALATRRLAWWAALGIALGLGALAKYQVAVTLACVLAVLWHQRAWRDPAHRRGAALAGVLALALFGPHLVWLLQQHDGPIEYALGTSLGASFGPGSRLESTAQWLADQVLNRALPAWILLAALAGALRRQAPATPPSDAARAMLLIWGVLPLAFIVTLGVSTGADLQLQWGTPFLLFAVPAAMEAMRPLPWGRLRIRRVLAIFIGVQGLLVALCVAQSPWAPEAWRDAHWRQVDARRWAQAVAPLAREALGGPVRVIIGPSAIAGALAMGLPEQPLVLIDGRYDRSPWVQPGLVARHGALEVAPAPYGPDAAAFQSLAPGWFWRIVSPQPTPAPPH